MSLFDDMHVLKKIIDNPLNQISRETGLTVNGIRVLLFLYSNEKYDIASDIVAQLMISKAHVSISIDELVKENYLKRVQDNKDKKKIHLKLTHQSKEVLDLVIVEVDKIKNKITKDIKNEDMEIFKKTLKKIIQNTKDIIQ